MAKMQFPFFGALSLLAGILWTGCGSLPSEQGDSAGYVAGNPEGYDVFVLTAARLDSAEVTINGLTVDPSDVNSVSVSTAAMLASRHQYNVVEEIADAENPLAVDFDAPGKPVPDTFYGVNMQWFSARYVTRPLYRALVDNIHVDIVRFPGGQERGEYDRDAEPLRQADIDRDSPYQFLLTGREVAEWIDFCDDLGMEAELEVNLCNDDPVMWADAVDQIVNELGYDLNYISCGNEPDVNTANNWTFLGAANITAAMEKVAARYKSYRTAIDGVKDTGLTYVFGEYAMWGDWAFNQTLAPSLTLAADRKPEAVSFHWYMLGGGNQSSSDPAYPSMNHMVMSGNGGRNMSTFADQVERVRSESEAAFGGAGIFVGELGPAWLDWVSGKTFPVLKSMMTALFCAEIYEMGKEAGVDSLQWFSLSDPVYYKPWEPALIGVDGDRYELRPQYYVFWIYKHLWGSETVTLRDNRTDNWSIHASKGGDTRYLMLVNRSANTVYRKDVRVTAGGSTQDIRLTLYPRSLTVIRF